MVLSMRILVHFGDTKRVITLTDDDDIWTAITQTFSQELGTNSFNIEVYSELFQEFISMSDEEIKDGSKLNIVIEKQTSLAKGRL